MQITINLPSIKNYSSIEKLVETIKELDEKKIIKVIGLSNSITIDIPVTNELINLKVFQTLSTVEYLFK